MGHAYTPGLKVTKRAVVRKKRLLPIKGDVLVKVGDKVSPGDIVAKTELPGIVLPVNIANRLGALPADVPSITLIKEGERVPAETVVASNKSFFGLFTNEYKTPITATLESVSNITGQLILRGDPIPVQVRAYITGTITEIFPGEGVMIEEVAAYIQGIFGIGGEVDGILEVVSQKLDDILDVDKIKPEHKDKILVAGALVTGAALNKAVEYGVKGIITGGFEDQDLKDFLGYDIGVAITGTEEKGITLVVTEGFGEIKMAPRTFDLLKSHHGHQVSINGSTQIRAGVIRPEVIIPLGEELKDDIPPAESTGAALKIGANLRIIRRPNFGEIGVVTELPPDPTELDSGTYARILKLKLNKNGEEVIVPRSNVEMIEE
jgi:hypothetical protein